MGTDGRETTCYENLNKSKTHRNQTFEDYFQTARTPEDRIRDKWLE